MAAMQCGLRSRAVRRTSALLLLNGVIYTGRTSHCDIRPYTGWIMGYSESTLAQTSVLNVTPNGNEGSIWMAGAGLAATNLNASGFPTDGDYGNAFTKLSTSGNQLSVADYFEMDNESSENSSDTDLGSGGTIVLPDLSDGSGHTLHLAVGAGKDSNLYLVNRDSREKFSSNNSNIYQELAGALPGGVWAMPAYFNNTVYYGLVGNPIQAFTQSWQAAQLHKLPTALGIAARPPASRRMARATESCGPSRTAVRRYCTLTAPRIRANATTATKPPAAATSSAQATSSSRQRLRTAKYS